MNERTPKKNTALALTFCGIMAALGVVIMLAGGLLAVATYCAPLLASVCLIPMLCEFGRGRAFLGYVVTAVLSALLSADKESAFFYVFIGYYPIIRGFFFRLRPRLLRILLKLLFFAAATAASYVFLCFVLRLDAVLEELGSASLIVNAALFGALVLALLVFDAVLGRAELIYANRLRPRLRFLK